MSKKSILISIGLSILFIFTRGQVYAKNNDLQKKENKIPILTYHHIIKEEDIIKNNQVNNTSILSLEEFERQMKYLYDNKFYVASLDELYDHLYSRITLPERSVVITFDDGYLSNKIYAYPILKNYNYRASMFLIGEILQYSVYDFDPSKIQFLRLGQLEDMKDVFDYENHTFAMHGPDGKGHSLLIRSKSEDIYDDMMSMKNLLNSNYLAYPRGQNNDTAIREIKKSGHKLAFTVKPGYITRKSNHYKLPRFPISKQETPFPVFKQIVDRKYKSSRR